MRSRPYKQYALVTGTLLSMAFGSLLFFQRMDETRHAQQGTPDNGMESVTILFLITGGALALSSLLPARKE